MRLEKANLIQRLDPSRPLQIIRRIVCFTLLTLLKYAKKKKLMNIYTGRKKKKLHEYLNLNVNIYV